MIDLAKYYYRLENLKMVKWKGNVSQVLGLIIKADGLRAEIGEVCLITSPKKGSRPIWAEVVGFKETTAMLMPLGEMEGVSPGAEVVALGRSLEVGVGPQLLGRVLDGLGRPFDDLGSLNPMATYSLNSKPPHPLKRSRIKEVLPLGIKAIDGLITCGRGQRLGIFSGSGVGKSTLMGMIARNTAADINVIALIGERGREVREFLEQNLGAEGLARSVVVVATSDQPALVRVKAAMLATAISEYFRDQGYDVLFMMDSVTRFAMAQREIGLAVGEPPTSRGYTPSVFAMLPRLLERTGTSEKGTITGLYTVLVDGDDMNEPVADAVRGILDGHIVLSRELAEQNLFPAIDVLQSVSRVMYDLVNPEYYQAAARFRNILATYRGAKDLIEIGAYQAGSNGKIDQAIAMIDQLNSFIKQNIDESYSYEQVIDQLLALTGGLD